jgi:hypothetical protein
MLAPLGIGVEETEVGVLLSLEVPYQLGQQAELIVDPDELGIPFTYGLSTEHMPEELFDWTEWFGQWCQEELA